MGKKTKKSKKSKKLNETKTKLAPIVKPILKEL